MIPLSATFILFDFVIHNPDNDTTQENLALLDRAAEFFSQIDYDSEGALPGKIISRFAGIARQYALNFQDRDPQSILPKVDMQQGIIPVWDYAPNIDFSDVDVCKYFLVFIDLSLTKKTYSFLRSTCIRILPHLILAQDLLVPLQRSRGRP